MSIRLQRLYNDYQELSQFLDTHHNITLRNASGDPPEKYQIEWSGFTDEAKVRLLQYPWPGNVRELRNLVERCVVLSYKGAIDVAELPGELLAFEPPERSAQPGQDLSQLPYEEARMVFERDYMLGILDRHGGNISQAAAYMKIHRQTLQYKLKQLGIRKAWSE